jgi:hypothetical protein
MLLAEISLLSVCTIDEELRRQRRVQTFAAYAVELEHSVGLAQVVPLPFSIPHSLA